MGGSKGLIRSSEDLSALIGSASAAVNGQNGQRLSRKVPLQAACGKAAKHKRHHRSRAHNSRSAHR